jgi:hypothetical protein
VDHFLSGVLVYFPSGATMARVQGQSASYNITEIRWARAIPSVPSDQAASVARGEFHPGTVELLVDQRA